MASTPLADQPQQQDRRALLGEGDSRVGLSQEATLSIEEVWYPLLSSALQEFDHRVDFSRHQQLLLQADVLILVPAHRIVHAVQQEMATSRSSRVLESGRDVATIAYDLAAFCSHPGPYTLFEIYNCFSFADKISAIEQQASQEMLAMLRAPGGGLLKRMQARKQAETAEVHEEVRQSMGTQLEAMQMDHPSESSANDAPQVADAEQLRASRQRWWPPTPSCIKLYLQAGASPSSVDLAGQTPVASLCEAAVLCVREASQDQSWSEVNEARREKHSRAHLLDDACAETLACLAQEAPASLFAEDSLMRTPLCVMAEAFGLADGLPSPNPPDAVPLATLGALCEGFGRAFAAAPSHVLLAVRCNSGLRDAAQAFADWFQETPPAPLLRLLDWIEVAMGGAWEVVPQEGRFISRVLSESVLDVEEMVDSALRLNSYTEKVEHQVQEWKREEAELKLMEFEARCAKKSSQYEDRIARLEAEIARRARSTELTETSNKKGKEAVSEGDVWKVKPEVAQDAGKIDDVHKVGSATPFQPDDQSATAQAKLVIESIRSDRLVDCELDTLSEEMQTGLLGMRRSLCAAVERLATDLYADECHCLWELMQNADDNRYSQDTGFIPELTLGLHVESGFGAYVLTSNNELGLTTEDVRAICNVNASIKGVGQTGHKGIGWKSVFRISDCPHVLSGNFAFKFDVAGPMGKLALVTPTNLTEEERDQLPQPVRSAQEAGNTVMFLPLRSEGDAPAVEAELRQIAAQHLCLVFLRRLRRITLRFADSSCIRLEQSKADFAQLYFAGATAAVRMTEISEAGENRCQVMEYVLHHEEVAIPDEKALAQLTLAFPAALATCEVLGVETVDDELFEAPLQPLFTFLPVKVVGLKFAIQGSFDLTADRSNLHGKSVRNRALCSAVPRAFKHALEQLPGLRSRALDLLGQETPEAVWLAVRAQLMEVLQEVPCIPSEPDGTLVRPGDCVLPAEEAVSQEALQYLPPDVLWECCSRRLVRKQWAERHRSQLQGLGMKAIGLEHWLKVLQVGRSANCIEVATVNEVETIPEKRSIAEIAAAKKDHSFFRRLFAMLAEAVEESPEVLQCLRQLPLVPDSKGNALCLEDGPIFSSFASDVPQHWQEALEAVGAMRLLAPGVQSVLSASANSFLRTAGVKRPLRNDIVAICLSWHLHVSRRVGAAAQNARRARIDDSDNAVRSEEGSQEQGGADVHYPHADTPTTRSAVWASLACLRAHFLSDNVSLVAGNLTTWRELGSMGLLVPCSSTSSGFGPCQRLTCPTYLGEAAGSDLQQDVLVAIMRFIYGLEAAAQDIGVFADAPPSWLQKGDGEGQMVADKLDWEAFFDELGMRRLSPCTSQRKIAGTVLTIDLGRRLSSTAWWRSASASKAGFSYLKRRLDEADRVEITWLKQLRSCIDESVDVSDLFLRTTYVRYGGHFLPYFDFPEPSSALLACLKRLGIATDVTGPCLRKCLKLLEARDCHDVSVFADVYAALQRLPQQEQASTGSWGMPDDPGKARVFLPPGRFENADRCIWTDGGRSVLRWLCGFAALQPVYGRFGNECRAWLLGPHVNVLQDLSCLEAAEFLSALQKLMAKVDEASRVPLEDRDQHLAGHGAPSAAMVLEELQSAAVEAYKHLAVKCGNGVHEEKRQRARGAVALAFQHEALIVMTDKDWPRPKRLKSIEAFWDVHADLASSKAAKLAMKHRLPPDDLELLRPFFVETVGIPECLTQEDLEARLRVPLRQEEAMQSSWQDGLGLGDFEDMATIRRGPGVLGSSPQEGGDFFQPIPSDSIPAGQFSSQIASEFHHEPPGGPLHGQADGHLDIGQREGVEEGEEEHDISRSSGMQGNSDQRSQQSEDAAVDPQVHLKETEEQEDEDPFDWEVDDVSDPYQVLGLPRDADEEMIRRAYKKLALKYHPDKNRGSELAQRRFQAISTAYDTLRDAEKRQAYDESCKEKTAAAEEPSPVPEPSAMSPEEAQDLFQSCFGSDGLLRESQAASPPSSPQGAQASCSAPSARETLPPSASSSHRKAPGQAKPMRLSKEEYEQLFRRLQEAEDSVKTWSDEVQSVRKQLLEAEENRDRYLRILQDCYDRSSSSEV